MSRQALDTPTQDFLRSETVVADKYRLDSLLAEGGMGSVWVATNLVLEKQVAIKVLHSDQRNELAEARLLREARAAAQIGHSNIVQVFDFGHINTGEPYIVMELLRGEDLAARLDRVGRLSAVEAVKLFLPITSALAAGHAKGIIHRDMKPGNIFISVDDAGNETPKVVDFGIAKVETPRYTPKLTMDGRVVGSPEYLSPEQARGEDDLDATTDVWALCVTLYESVTGDLPFHDENYNRLLRKIIESQPRPITDYAAGDVGLWSIVSRGLSKHRGARWSSMEELGKALEAWLAGHGVQEIPRVRFSSVSGASGASGDSVLRRRRSRASTDGDAEPTLMRLPAPVPGPPPSVSRPSAGVPLLIRPNVSENVVSSSPQVRPEALSASRVEAPPVFGDKRKDSDRARLDLLKLGIWAVLGLAVGGIAVALIMILVDNMTGASSQDVGSPVVSVQLAPVDSVSLPVDKEEPVFVDEPEFIESVPEQVVEEPVPEASHPPAIVPRRPPKPRPPIVPVTPNF